MSNTSVDRVPEKGLSFLCPRSTGLHPKQEFDIAGWNLSFSFEFFIICVLRKNHSALYNHDFAHVSGLLDWIISTREL
jgi:hypothetical protein